MAVIAAEISGKPGQMSPVVASPCDMGHPRVEIPTRAPLRCRTCRGNLFLEAETGGHIYALTCFQCGRVDGHMGAVQLVREFGVTWQALERMCMPFLWDTDE